MMLLKQNSENLLILASRCDQAVKIMIGTAIGGGRPQLLPDTIESLENVFAYIMLSEC